jgi:hypothetical protein
MMQSRVYTFSFASGATGTNKQYVGPHRACFLVASLVTNFNAGTNNTTISIRGGLSATDTHADMTSMSVATHTAKGVYPMPYAGLHYMSVGFATAVTGGAANTIDVVVYDI